MRSKKLSVQSGTKSLAKSRLGVYQRLILEGVLKGLAINTSRGSVNQKQNFCQTSCRDVRLLVDFFFFFL